MTVNMNCRSPNFSMIRGVSEVASLLRKMTSSLINSNQINSFQKTVNSIATNSRKKNWQHHGYLFVNLLHAYLNVATKTVCVSALYNGIMSLPKTLSSPFSCLSGYSSSCDDLVEVQVERIPLSWVSILSPKCQRQIVQRI